jgi:hypothetical protein
MAVKAIPTVYRSTRFRSRLEARWAAFFDLAGWYWVYEPFDCGGWIPDFIVTGVRRTFYNVLEGGNQAAENGQFLIEVGPCVTEADYQEKSQKPLRSDTELPVVVVGVSPRSPWSEDHPFWKTDNLGLQVNGGEWPAPATLGYCLACGAVSVTHSEGVFTHRPCGHYTGGDTGLELSCGTFSVEEAWGMASNATQWHSG